MTSLMTFLTVIFGSAVIGLVQKSVYWKQGILADVTGNDVKWSVYDHEIQTHEYQFGHYELFLVAISILSS